VAKIAPAANAAFRENKQPSLTKIRFCVNITLPNDLPEFAFFNKIF